MHFNILPCALVTSTDWQLHSHNFQLGCIKKPFIRISQVQPTCQLVPVLWTSFCCKSFCSATLPLCTSWAWAYKIAAHYHGCQQFFVCCTSFYLFDYTGFFLEFTCNSNYIATNKVHYRAKQILTQKFDSPGFQIEHQLNWKVHTFSQGIQ